MKKKKRIARLGGFDCFGRRPALKKESGFTIQEGCHTYSKKGFATPPSIRATVLAHNQSLGPCHSKMKTRSTYAPSFTFYDEQVSSSIAGSGALALGGCLLGGRPSVASVDGSNKVEFLEKQATEIYGEMNFKEAANVLGELVKSQPDNFKWSAARAEAYVDMKDFEAAVRDYDAALAIHAKHLTGEQQYIISDSLTDAGFDGRLLSGRALAYEGLANWEKAIKLDYDRAIEIAFEQNVNPDPYVVNSRDYLAARDLFQRAKGFRGELGEEQQALREMVAISRRGPGSVDIRAALAALYWHQGQDSDARQVWQYACERINAGCGKYLDKDWVGRIRRWPPIMTGYLNDFIAAQTLS
eukprot:jgi/Bigna1/141934/aug1.66_g16642